jgi:hypothetical protein
MIGGHASDRYRVSSNCTRASSIVDLRLRVDLVRVEISLEVVQLVWIRFLSQNSRSVVAGERLRHRVRVVHEIEDKDIVLLRMRAVQTRQRLHCLEYATSWPHFSVR